MKLLTRFRNATAPREPPEKLIRRRRKKREREGKEKRRKKRKERKRRKKKKGRNRPKQKQRRERKKERKKKTDLGGISTQTSKKKFEILNQNLDYLDKIQLDRLLIIDEHWGKREDTQTYETPPSRKVPKPFKQCEPNSGFLKM